MSNKSQNSVLPSSIEEQLKKLEEQGVEEFASKMVNDSILDE